MPPESGQKPRAAPRILIVDDDASQRSLLDSFLRSQGFETLPVASGERALEALRSGEFSMMISDVRMPGLSGLETLRRARKEHGTLPILLVTAYADIREAVGAMRDGALNYLSKPIDLDELLASVRHATGLVADAPLKFSADKELPAHVVARSPLMQAVLRDASLVAPSESRVLITGESGVGKEVLADVIHAWSPRSSGPLVKVNCAAIPETLLESELFGHERGAFTGASAQRIGRFELANSGTIFLDEIGEMSPQLQAKLLRVTQDGRFQRVGSNTEIQTNARILAASNRNLEEEVAKGRFREDLFYRLNVIELNIPPLRERREDILPLAEYFLQRLAEKRKQPAAQLSREARAFLLGNAWPGNVRELEHTLERAVLMARSNELHAADLGLNFSRANSQNLEELSLEAVEAILIRKALQRFQGNVSQAADALGLSRGALYRRMEKYGL
jgi:DNA-binding NtrC family response regulator